MGKVAETVSVQTVVVLLGEMIWLLGLETEIKESYYWIGKEYKYREEGGSKSSGLLGKRIFLWNLIRKRGAKILVSV